MQHCKRESYKKAGGRHCPVRYELIYPPLSLSQLLLLFFSASSCFELERGRVSVRERKGESRFQIGDSSGMNGEITRTDRQKKADPKLLKNVANYSGGSYTASSSRIAKVYTIHRHSGLFTSNVGKPAKQHDLLRHYSRAHRYQTSP